MAEEVTIHITFTEKNGREQSLTRYGARSDVERGEPWEDAALRVAKLVLDQVDEDRRGGDRW